MKKNKLLLLTSLLLAFSLVSCNNESKTNSNDSYSTQISSKVSFDIEVSGNGTASLYKDEYFIGDTVVILVTPDRGNYLGRIEVDNEILSMKDGVYKFVAEKNSYLIKVIFAQAETNINDFTFIFNEEDNTASIQKYSTYLQIPNPVVIPETVTYNNKTYVVTSIEKNAFSDIDVRSIKLSKNIVTLSENLFDDVFNLEEIIVDSENPVYSSLNGLLLNKSGDTLIYSPVAYSKDEIVVPEQIIHIGDYAFSNNKKVKSIKLPANLETIGKYAFNFCTSIDSISIPSKVSIINEGLFVHCHELQNIEFLGNVVEIKSYAFQNCNNLIKFTCPSSLKIIDEFAFYDCGLLRDLELNEGLTTISNSAFSRNMSLINLTLPSTVTYIGKYAFSETTALRSIAFNEGLKTIDDMAFSNSTYLVDFEIPSSVENIGINPFFGNAGVKNIKVNQNNQYFTSVDGVLYTKDLKKLISYPFSKQDSNVTLDEGLEVIGTYAFAYNDKIDNLTLPKSLKEFGEAPFVYSQGIKIYYNGTISEYQTIINHDIINADAALFNNYVYCSDGDFAL